MEDNSSEKIRIEIQGEDSGVSETMRNIRASAKELAEGMIGDAAEIAESGKELVKILEEQIKAIERRNKAQLTNTVADLDFQLEEKTINRRQYNTQVSEAEKAAEEDSLQITVLREIVATLRENARDEERSNRELTEGRISSIESGETSVSDLQGEELINYLLQRNRRPPTLQDQDGDGEQDDPDDESQGGGSNASQKALGYGTRALSNVTSAQNDVFAMAAFLTMIPLVGTAVGGLVNKTLSQSVELDTAQGRLRALSLDNEETDGLGGSASRFGLTRAQFASQYALPTAKAMGTVDDMGQTGLDVLATERSMGISSGVLNETLRTLRQADDQSLLKTVGGLTQALQERGTVSETDFTLIEEYLSIANTLAQGQISRLDNIDTGINSTVIAELSQLGGSFANPQVLGKIIQSIDSGIQNPSTQYAQAMQFSTLSNLNPNASRFELMEMQEKGIQDPRILKGVLDQLKNASGDNEDLFNEQLKALYPQLSFSQTRKLGKSYLSGDLDFSGEPEVDEKKLRGFLTSRSGEVTSDLQQRTAVLDNMLAIKGQEISNQIGQLVDQFGGFQGILGGMLDAGIGTLDGINSLVKYFTGGAPAQKTNEVKKK